MKKIVIIFPAYNEEITIAQTIEAFFKEIPSAQFVVVNNNSKDQTAIIATATIEKLAINGEVLEEHRQGKGNALRRAFMHIEADIYVICDADLTYPANQIHKMIKLIAENKADMVVGDRISGGHYQKENKRNFHGFGNNIVRWITGQNHTLLTS